MIKEYLFLLAFPALATYSSAAVVITEANPGDINNPAGLNTITITDELIFTIETTGEFRSLIFNQWLDSAGSSTASSIGAPMEFNYTINGSLGSHNWANLRPNLVGVVNDVSPRDGRLLTFGPGISVNATDTLVIKPGSWTFPGAPDFDPQLVNLNFDGDVFLVNSSEQRISNVTQAPEPSAAMLFTLGSIVFFLRRR